MPKKAKPKQKKVPAKNASCSKEPTRGKALENITKRLGYKPKHLYSVPVQKNGKSTPRWCTSVRTIKS